MNRVKMSGMFYGLLTIIALIMVTSFIISLLLRFTGMTEDSFSLATLVISFFALFFGGFISGKKAKDHGWMIGATTGILYALVVFFIQYLGFDHGFSGKQDLYFLMYIGVSSFGGMIGVNLSANDRQT